MADAGAKPEQSLNVDAYAASPTSPPQYEVRGYSFALARWRHFSRAASRRLRCSGVASRSAAAEC